MNAAFVLGRTTRNIEVKTTNSGKKVARFTLAVNRRGEGADYIPCIAWEKTAEILSTHVSKGQQIAVCGRLVSGSYEKNGQRINTIDLNVTEFDFCGPKQEETRTERRRREERKRDEMDGFENLPEDYDEDAPFI